ncbi:MAG: hypothetical protein VCC00_14635 [Deltaproteobacteria bacterium]
MPKHDDHPHSQPLLRRFNFIGVIGALLLLLLAGSAHAQAVSGTIVIDPVPEGATKSDTVTFKLTRKLHIGDTVQVLPNVALAGTHTCTFNPDVVENAATDGHHVFYARFNRGSKLGSVFRGRLTAGVGTLLFGAGCDGDPATLDAFQGDETAYLAELPVYVNQILLATEFHPDGATVLDEIRAHFVIKEERTLKIPRIAEFHGFEMLNRGGSAAGRASVRIKLVFKPA